MQAGAKLWVLSFGLSLPNLHFLMGLISVYKTQNILHLLLKFSLARDVQDLCSSSLPSLEPLEAGPAPAAPAATWGWPPADPGVIHPLLIPRKTANCIYLAVGFPRPTVCGFRWVYAGVPWIWGLMSLCSLIRAAEIVHKLCASWTNSSRLVNRLRAWTLADGMWDSQAWGFAHSLVAHVLFNNSLIFF